MISGLTLHMEHCGSLTAAIPPSPIHDSCQLFHVEQIFVTAKKV
jgi:hypothetical protein